MTVLKIEKVGLIAHYSKKGDWAFRLALEIAGGKNLQLNIFHFLESPYEVSMNASPGESCTKCWEEKVIMEKDRYLREYFDKYLGDYVNVGFRICESGRHNYELKQCLKDREYQLLVIPYIDRGVPFGNMPIEEFAYRFLAPVVLVGPDRPDEYHTNPAARLLIDSYVLQLEGAASIPRPERFQERKVI